MGRGAKEGEREPLAGSGTFFPWAIQLTESQLSGPWTSRGQGRSPCVLREKKQKWKGEITAKRVKSPREAMNLYFSSHGRRGRRERGIYTESRTHLVSERETWGSDIGRPTGGKKKLQKLFYPDPCQIGFVRKDHGHGNIPLRRSHRVKGKSRKAN